MKKILNISILSIILLISPISGLYAGNEDRAGQAGASELLINPWARTTGWAGANTAAIRGLEAQFGNVAGLAFSKGTEILFCNTQWLRGSGVSINAFGFAQSLGENKGVLGFGIVSMGMDDIEITTYDQPEGGIGKFSPKLMNINISYAKAFSNSIFGGINFKIINESISDVGAQGIAIDAGIQYITGASENIKFGIALKNVGPTLKFKGDGLSFRGFIPGNPNTITVEQRSDAFELPSLVNIGAAYDFRFAPDNILTAAVNFTSNSFIRDQYSLGLQYNWKHILYLRAGYMYENDILSDYDQGRSTAMTGPAAGFSIQAPLNKEKGTYFSFDYSYRHSDPFDGTHSIGARITL
jgi:hypothetical protein